MQKESKKIDRVFNELRSSGDFVFDEKVADVFDDMINRSIPGYATIISMIGVLANRYYQDNTNIYDLGCSLGGASFTILDHLQGRPCSIVAIDCSAPMIERLEYKKRAFGDHGCQIHSRCESIQESAITDASVVVLNFTLQFLATNEREAIVRKIYQGMKPGGILIISEKIEFSDEGLNSLLINSYHNFKENMGYSALEISQKRTALENVLIPENLDTHKQRLINSGFSSIEVWFQCFNFASMIAIK
tara:strand:+ start:83 stop:823 length:741 start_codon:yes stop_codon:yes gene_type:complete